MTPVPTAFDVTRTPSITPAVSERPLPGNRNDDAGIAIDELIRGVNIALGLGTLDSCPAFDTSGDGNVTVDGLQSPTDGAFVRTGRNGRMIRLRASQVREDFADTLNRVAFKGERIVLHRHGKNVAALVPLADLEALEALEDRVDLPAARKALREKGTVPLAVLKARLRP